MIRGATALLLLLFACKSSSPTPPTTILGPGPTEVDPIVPPTPAPVDPGPPAAPADAQLLAECRDQLAKAKAEHAAIATDRLEHLNELGRIVANASSMGSLYSEVHPDAKVREAARTCEQEATAMMTSMFSDKAVFDAVSKVDVKAADANTKRFVEVI